jgi:hypothetical protein
LVVCRRNQSLLAAAYAAMTRTRRLKPPEPQFDEEPYTWGHSAYEAALADVRALTGLKRRVTKPLDRAADIAAFWLCREMRNVTGGPQHGVVGQLLVHGELLRPGQSYATSRLDVINREKKADAGLEWPSWTLEWQ